MTHGWWRRNRWGLIVLVPVLALAIGLQLDDAYHLYWNGQPRQPVAAGPDGWADFAGGRIRLVELGPAADVEAPTRTQVWRARLEFAVPAQDTLGACDISVEDEAGRVFEARPDELIGADVPFPSCTPELDTPARNATGPVTFSTVAHFVLPAGARPVAVRVTQLTALPRYARLTLVRP